MYKFKFADIGEGIHEGKVFEIFVSEGENVKDGQNLLSVETDKITAEIPCPVNGKIAKILVKKGEVIHVGQDLFEIDDGTSTTEAKVEAPKLVVPPQPTPTNVASQKLAEPEQGASVVGEVKISNDVLSNSFFSSKKSDSTKSNATISQGGTNTGDISKHKFIATPIARAIARERGIQLSDVVPTGENGRILRSDVEKTSPKSAGSSHSIQTQVVQQSTHQATVAPTPSAKPSSEPANQSAGTLTQQQFFGSENSKRVAPTRVRQAIAKSMKDSWNQVAYTSLVNEVDVTELVSLRASVKDMLEKQGIKMTYLPYIVKAFAKALTEHFEINSSFDMKTNEIVYHRDINVGIAVDAPNGLFVPVIKNADTKTVIQIAAEIASIASKVRAGTITMAEMSGGTFTVTNFGSVGSMWGTPVIKPGEMAIGGVGTMVKRPKFNSNDQVVPGLFMYISVAGDHQWIDGANIGRFANRVKQLLENPVMLLH